MRTTAEPPCTTITQPSLVTVSRATSRPERADRDSRRSVGVKIFKELKWGFRSPSVSEPANQFRVSVFGSYRKIAFTPLTGTSIKEQIYFVFILYIVS